MNGPENPNDMSQDEIRDHFNKNYPLRRFDVTTYDDEDNLKVESVECHMFDFLTNGGLVFTFLELVGGDGDAAKVIRLALPRYERVVETTDLSLRQPTGLIL